MKFFQVKTVEETFQLIRDKVAPLTEQITMQLFDALHFVLAEDIHVRENVPNFRRSSVDGFAVKATDTFGSSENVPGFLTVVGEVKMGLQPEYPIRFGETMYVPTGGMIPEGSDAVIMIEHCENIDGLLNLYRQVAPGENVIAIGEDLKEGNVLLTKGTMLRAQEIGALASQGVTDVIVYRKPVIGYLSTGDEVVEVDALQLALGEVRDMNGATIGAQVKGWGLSFVYGGIVKDNRTELERRTREMLDQTDCLIISGGSSVGTKDYSVEVIDTLGDPGVFVHGISIKPGKPTILAVANKKPVIGLPGHPASAMIIFHLFGRAVIESLQGVHSNEKRLSFAKVTKNIPSSPGRTDFIRATLYEENGEWFAEPIFGKSGLISTLVKSEGMIEISPESEGIHKGENVPIRLFQ